QEPGVFVPHHPRARTRRDDDALRVLEELDRPPGDSRGLGVIARIEERQTAARLVAWRFDTDAELAEQPHDRDCDFGEEQVAQARHERRGAARRHAWGGGGVTRTTTSRRASPSLTSPCSTPAGATSASPASRACSAAPSRNRPRPSRTR